MEFINRRSEYESFKSNYERNSKKSRVYIVEASHGVGKSAFISEASKFFSQHPLDISQSKDLEELSMFKKLIFELDKVSFEFEYDDFKTFFSKKINNAKAILFLKKVTAVFVQACAKIANLDVNFVSLLDSDIPSEEFILEAQPENLFNYTEYVFSKKPMHIIFHHASSIDAGSSALLSKLITKSNGGVFIFECCNDTDISEIEKSLRNVHNICYERYSLDKLSEAHIQTYIQQLLSDLKLEANLLNSSELKESINRGDLAEITSILKDYNTRVQQDTLSKIRSINEILQGLSEEQSALLILIGYANGKLNFVELKDILNKLDNSFSMATIDFLLEKNLIEKGDDYSFLQPFVSKALDTNSYGYRLKYAVASALIRYLSMKLEQNYNNRYVDVLVDYHLCNKQIQQLTPQLPRISQRLQKFNTQAERADYFKKFLRNRQILCENHKDLATKFAKLAYDANLYFDAMEFINLASDTDDNIIFIKALVLNRCEKFNQSIEYIDSKLKEIDISSSTYFNLSLVRMMNLIQLNDRGPAKTIFNELKLCDQEPLYPYLIRLSNVFYDDLTDRLGVVESITENIYKKGNNEFSGLHAVYLAYLYALTSQPKLAENALLEARDFFGSNLSYNHMILHNEATIKFHNHEINEDIPALLKNAKITAYDEYDNLAINNNLLVYYILSESVSTIECQNIVTELEDAINKTNFKRFLDKVYYNLYFYYTDMFNYDKIEYYRTELLQKNIQFDDDDYKYKLMYETSWKLPIDIHF